MCLAVDAGRKLTSGQSEDGVDQMGIREGRRGGGEKCEMKDGFNELGFLPLSL